MPGPRAEARQCCVCRGRTSPLLPQLELRSPTTPAACVSPGQTRRYLVLLTRPRAVQGGSKSLALRIQKKMLAVGVKSKDSVRARERHTQESVPRVTSQRHPDRAMLPTSPLLLRPNTSLMMNQVPGAFVGLVFKTASTLLARLR